MVRKLVECADGHSDGTLDLQEFYKGFEVATQGTPGADVHELIQRLNTLAKLVQDKKVLAKRTKKPFGIKKADNSHIESVSSGTTLSALPWTLPAFPPEFEALMVPPQKVRFDSLPSPETPEECKHETPPQSPQSLEIASPTLREQVEAMFSPNHPVSSRLSSPSTPQPNTPSRSLREQIESEFCHKARPHSTPVPPQSTPPSKREYKEKKPLSPSMSIRERVEAEFMKSPLHTPVRTRRAPTSEKKVAALSPGLSVRAGSEVLGATSPSLRERIEAAFCRKEGVIQSDRNS